MHPIARFALAAPLALALAACGETTDVDDRVVQTGGVEPPADVRLPQVDVEYPQVPLDARGTVDYVGTYELRTADDQVSTIALAADDVRTDAEMDARFDALLAGEEAARRLEALRRK